MFTKLSSGPRIESAYFAYEMPRTIFCEGKADIEFSLDRLIKDKETWGTLYAVACIYWLEQVFPSRKHLSECPYSFTAVAYEVDEKWIVRLLEHLFEQIVIDKAEQGERRKVTVKNLSEQGKRLGGELFTKHTSAALEHFYWNREMPKEAPAERFTWYAYKPDVGQNYSKEFEETLDKDWFMQYLIHTSGIALEATSLSQKELDEDIFVQYLASHVKELYLSVNPKMWPDREKPSGVNNRKLLFWNRKY